MNNEELEQALNSLCKNTASLMNKLSPRDQRKLYDIEVVFMDIVNNRPRPNRGMSFLEIIQALNKGGIPIGLILVDNEFSMHSEAFSVTSELAQEILAHALAEAEDEAQHMMMEDEDEN